MVESSSGGHPQPATNGYAGLERRRNGRPGLAPSVALKALPALVVLERIPVPVLAIAHEGTILFANAAFAAMIGHSQETLLSLTFPQIFHSMPADVCPVSVLRAYGGSVVELAHADGFILRAHMSKSALLRGDDPVALATFLDLTDDLWHRR